MIINCRELKTYEELCTFSSFEDRLAYLMLYGSVGFETFGADRIFNQRFYKSDLWLDVRDRIIVRDNGCNMGLKDYELSEITLHHMNPILLTDIVHRTDILLNPNYLICVSPQTHRAIHYQTKQEIFLQQNVERKPFDTSPWRNGGRT